ENLLLLSHLVSSVCRMTFPTLPSVVVILVVFLPFQLLPFSLAPPSRPPPFPPSIPAIPAGVGEFWSAPHWWQSVPAKWRRASLPGTLPGACRPSEMHLGEHPLHPVDSG